MFSGRIENGEREKIRWIGEEEAWGKNRGKGGRRGWLSVKVAGQQLV